MNSNGQPRKRETTDAHADVSRHPETDEAEASAQKCTSVGGSSPPSSPSPLLFCSVYLERNEAQPREWAARTLLESFFPCCSNRGRGDFLYRLLEEHYDVLS